jgi:hypothetical protein
MGLRGHGGKRRAFCCCRKTRKGQRPHGILDVRPFAGETVDVGVDRYIRSLGRGPRRTMRKQVDAVFRAKGIFHQYQPNAAHALGWEHLTVCIAHQQRQLTTRCLLPLAVAMGVGRFFVAKCMTGGVDEFRVATSGASLSGRIVGRIVAWSQPIAKGQTLRGMWYYCRPEHDRSCIWFYTVRLNVARALRAGLSHVDAGPSDNASVAVLKEKYGFRIDKGWRETVCYDGAFVTLALPGAVEGKVAVVGGGGADAETKKES